MDPRDSTLAKINPRHRRTIAWHQFTRLARETWRALGQLVVRLVVSSWLGRRLLQRQIWHHGFVVKARVRSVIQLILGTDRGLYETRPMNPLIKQAGATPMMPARKRPIFRPPFA